MASPLSEDPNRPVLILEAGQDYADLQVLADDEALDAWLMRTVGTSRHISCTCRIGPDSDPMAVVDQYCRVRGMEGLRVEDCSVLPNVTWANTNATAIMIGERVADWIQ